MNYQEIFNKVWRSDTSQPGFYVIDAGKVDSRTLREQMVRIKEEFSKFVPFYYSWLMRFDQQVTTKFHRDGGPEENLLILGYEPSEVHSNLYIGDYLEFGVGQEMPQDKITKVPDFEEGHSYIVIMNNSKQLGIWHKGEILKPDPNKSRFINSMQLGKGERAASDDIAVHPQVVEKWIIGNE
jgi:hypothetical protein